MQLGSRTLVFAVVLFAAACSFRTASAQNDSDNSPPPARYSEIVLADQPVLYFPFDGQDEKAVQTHPQSSAAAQIKPIVTVGKVKLNVPGPTADRFPLFAADNQAIELFGDGGRLVLDDIGDSSPLDFDRGDAITLEAWVDCTKLANGQQMYIVGKGRTNNAGVASENQNYALRLSGENGQACVSFLFRSADNRAKERNDFHRYNTKTGFPVGSGWHHIAVAYKFGEPKSIRAFIDGEKLDGVWDYGGATDEAPVVDNDQIWIGSSMGGNPSSTFLGQIDEVALYRTALTDERIIERYKAIAPKSYVTEEVPQDDFLVEIFEGVPDKTSWKFPFPDPVDKYTVSRLAFLEVPHKYNARGVREDRTNPFVLRVTGWVKFPAEEVQLLLRSRDGVRVFLNDELAAENPFFTRGGDGHNTLYPTQVRIIPGITPLRTGDQEKLFTIKSDGKRQKLTMEIWCGGRGRRPELGETVLAVRPQRSDFHNRHENLEIVNAAQTRAGNHDYVVLTDGPAWQPPTIPGPIVRNWPDFNMQERKALAALNQQRRAQASAEYTAYWNKRHEQARKAVEAAPVKEPAPTDSAYRYNAIDDYINLQLKEAGVPPLAAVDDWTFLRRASLDIIGINPPEEIVRKYFAIPESARRKLIVDELLLHEGYADHWTSYWQDVLAENPNIINPTLNNTGPFRWWIHESFEDNKPMDRFATELVLMEGSLRGGGPAGFSMASQNDAPMAAKAHVIAQAFMGMEMKCARCHDAPYHDFTQKQLFSLAAMLKRSPEQLPKSSTIPGDPAALKSLLVKVTLKPGEKIPPEWPFAKIIDGEDAVDILQDKTDQRQRLAALVTSPHNHRFSQVLVNRVWARLMGKGIVDPVDDWEQPTPSHPELLEYLERSFVASGYDLKQLMQAIMTSHTYQRQVDVAGATDRDRARLLAGVPRRRLSAEQVVDSLFYAADKPFNVEDQNIDVDGGRKWDTSINLGPVTRSWQFASLSNERDRPSLSLPATQTVIDVLEAFGWRATRPDPLTVRTVDPSVLQAAVLENGVVGKRITQLSDDSIFTELALKAKSPEEFVTDLYERILVRKPTAAELAALTEPITAGFNERIVKDAPLHYASTCVDVGVSWSNHLQPEANERKTQLKERLEAGDPVTARLAPDWRERAEDVVWTLINSPEFVLVP